MTAAGDWPRTGRVLPWLLALFLVLVWLVPYEAIELSVSLPIDPHLDRFFLLGIGVVTIASVFASEGRRHGRPAPLFWRVLLIFTAVALASVALNAQQLANVGELDQSTKKIILLLGNLLLFYVVAMIIRPSELRNFSVFMVVLATIAAVGTLWEYRMEYNVFYDLADKIFSPIASVAPLPLISLDGREDTFGPTDHGLAITTMLTLALPFAVLFLMSARTRSRQILYGLAVAILLAGGLATLRKTSMVAPVAALLVLVAYRPRDMLRFAPFGVVMIGVVHLIAPGALGGVGDQLTGGFLETDTTIGRTADYQALSPDIATYPLAGRGYGTIDPGRADTYRILDNQYLGQLVQVGFVGLLAYIGLLVAGLMLAHSVIQRALTTDQRILGLASAASFVAFGVVSALFDLFSFSQVPYLFFFLAGMCSVAASQLAPARATWLEPLPATT
jgi:hypothetical protein